MHPFSRDMAWLVPLVVFFSFVQISVGLINLRAYNENGDFVTTTAPNETTTFHCSYGIAGPPKSIRFSNGTGHTIYMYDFITGEGFTGAGFEKRVTKVFKAGSSCFMDLFTPYCQQDGHKTCTVISELGMIERISGPYTTGGEQDPQIYMDGEHVPCGSRVPSHGLSKISCIVKDAVPNVTFYWYDCVEDGPVDSTHDPATCLYSYEAKANCWPPSENGCSFTCYAEHEHYLVLCQVHVRDEEDLHLTEI